MKKEDIEQKVFAYFNSGFHCVEAMLKTFVELNSKEPDPGITKFASGFGGGMGGSHCETCGALMGGIIVLGCLFGRKDPHDDKQKVFSLSAELRNQFLKNFSSTNCQNILGLMEKQEIKMECKKLTAETAGILYEILQKENVRRSG